ncbi:GTPase [Georgenia yuyongxinii]|uniref:GTPase n=1 Tax=Georgenia yuyongxinii TaxID=2589797 RepID=UPI00363EB718
MTAQSDVIDEVIDDRPDDPRTAPLTDLRAVVERLSFPLDLEATEMRVLRERVLTQVDTRLLPRLRGSVPAVVVLGGSTGAGKSTLLNTIVGAEVSEAGVLRPTTRRPVLAVHPDDAAALEAHPLTALADVVAHDGVPNGLAMLDAPDLDSVHADNRTLSAQLLQAADLWVFVTTAARYGDAIPWATLRDADERGISVAVVLNRVPTAARAAVRADLLTRLDAAGLGSVPLFLITDAGPHEGPLDVARTGELDAFLRLLARREQAAGVVRRTTRGTGGGLRAALGALADGADAQGAAVTTLRTLTTEAIAKSAAAISTALRDGQAAAGTPTAQWEAASDGGPLAPLVGAGRIRAGWRGRALADRNAAAQRVADAAAAQAELLLADALRAVPAALTRAWPDHGARALATATASPSADGLAGEVVTAWRAAVVTEVTPLAPRAHATLDLSGLAALVQAAGLGLPGASPAVTRLLGEEGAGVLDRTRADILARAGAAVRGAAAPYLDALAGLHTIDGTCLRELATELGDLA